MEHPRWSRPMAQPQQKTQVRGQDEITTSSPADRWIQGNGVRATTTEEGISGTLRFGGVKGRVATSGR